MSEIVIDYAEVIDGIIEEIYRLRKAEELLMKVDNTLFLERDKPLPDTICYEIDDFFRK